MSTRIYIVTEINDESPNTKWLIDAQTQAQAVRHITKNQFQVKVASPHEIVELMGKGVKVEKASE